MSLKYEICGDEAWTHGNRPLNRYWCFFGGLLGIESDIDRLEGDLIHELRKSDYRQEIKWSNLSGINLKLYKDLVEILFHHIVNHGIRFRQVFLDRAFIHVPNPNEPLRSNLDLQFLICYQFLKHSFGLQYLPYATEGHHEILIRLDTHSSQKHIDELQEYVEKLPLVLERTDLQIKIAHVNSHYIHRIGMVDVLLGAAGSYGNKWHLRRPNGQRGRTKRQDWRLNMAKFIYSKLGEIEKLYRGKKAFNWFESTGLDKDPSNRFNHAVRIWKFVPHRYQLDQGWQNEHLDSQGQYVGPKITPDIFSQSGH